MTGDDIKRLRKTLKMRQEDFCDKFKISQPYLSEIETGKNRYHMNLKNVLCLNMEKKSIAPNQLKIRT